MKKENWIWMPHAGHFICGHRCRFTLNTYVGKYIVSTIGEMPYSCDEIKEINRKHKGDKFNEHFDEVGLDRLYETMVFKARESSVKDSGWQCCPFEIIVEDEMDFEPYNNATDAYQGHLKLCNKWSKK